MRAKKLRSVALIAAATLIMTVCGCSSTGGSSNNSTKVGNVKPRGNISMSFRSPRAAGVTSPGGQLPPGSPTSAA